MAVFQAFDPLAIAVPDTAAALTIWRDQFGFPVVYSEVVNGGNHFCLGVADVSAAQTTLEAAGLATASAPHEGTQGKRALFLNSGLTQGVQVEITGS
jgi:hypothetical protein